MWCDVCTSIGARSIAVGIARFGIAVVVAASMAVVAVVVSEVVVAAVRGTSFPCGCE